jgi:starvation-inducible outer membrane lipoprotein
MSAKSALLSLAFAWVAALSLAACQSAPPKAASPKVATVSAAAAAPAPCQEEADKRKARVAGGQTVSMTTCARPSAEWGGERPGFEALRPHLNP